MGARYVLACALKQEILPGIQSDGGFFVICSLAGNELSGNGVGTRVGADQYVKDVIALKSVVDNVYRGNPAKPLVLAPGGFFDAGWFNDLILKTRPNLVNVVTHHIYNLGPGTQNRLIEDSQTKRSSHETRSEQIH
jgi:hypothetical protein